MTDDFEFDFDDMHPRTWVDAFPWLRGVVEPSVLGWWNEPIDGAPLTERDRRLAQLAELAIERLSQWPIGQIFPGLSPDLNLLELRLPVRAINALGRQNCSTGAELIPLTLSDVLEWRQVGVGTVDAILQALANASTSLATPSVTTRMSTRVEPDQPMRTTHDGPVVPEWMSSLIDDLSQIATWYATVGLPEHPLLGVPLAPGIPDEIVKARQRLEALQASDVLTDGEIDGDVAALFDDALATLDVRAVRVLADRLFADDPATLDELGRTHGVTRERVRQIEGKARGAMFGFISDGSQLAMLADAARDLIGTIRPLDDLLSVMPALANEVRLVGQPAWRVLDRLDDAYEIEDGWCVVPTLKAAESLTQTQLQEAADQYGVVHTSDVRLIETSEPDRLPELTRAWLTHCGYIVDGDTVFTRTQSVGDYAAAVLSVVGEPLSGQEIVDRFVFDRSVGSLKNAMNLDDRFERVDRDRWALREWGMEAYAGIRSVIREQVARGGGRVRLEDLVEYITSRYSVTASSVAAYASSPPFQCRGGVVSPADVDRDVRKTPERTRRMFRRAGAWAYRVRISTDHLRGSGSVAPMAVANILDLQYGETRQLESNLGPQSIAWTGTQPQFGTIRRFLMHEDVAAEAEAFLVMHDDGTFSFEPARELTGNPLLDSLCLVGAPMTTDRQAACVALATAIGLPANSPASSIIGGYRERGDGDIADLLTSVREYLETGHEPTQPKHSADVDEILGLL